MMAGGSSGHRLPMAVAALALAAAAVVACGHPRRAMPTPGRPLGDGESIGKIEPVGAGTAPAAKVHVLLAVECRGERLYLRTSVEDVGAAMRCADLQPRAAFEPYFGKPVSITYRGGQVVIENDTVGKIAIMASDPRITEVHVTPGP